jgi:hypothetical protein
MANYISPADAGYEVESTVGVISTTPAGKTKRVTLGKWQGVQEPRLDIRKWDENLNLGKGITLNEDEVRALRRILENTDFGK